MNLNFPEIVARKKLGRGDDWKWCAFESIGSTDMILKGVADMIITGGVPGKYVSGPRKGQDKWSGVPKDRVIVTQSEVDAAIASYETETGNCHNCGGSAEEWAGWSAVAGNRYRPCRKCAATGKAAKAAKEAK